MTYKWVNGVPVALLLAFMSMEMTLFSAGMVSCKRIQCGNPLLAVLSPLQYCKCL